MDCKPEVPKPQPMPVEPDGIPSELKDLDRWICWSWIRRGEKWDKPPLRADGRGFAKSDDPATWSSFESALEQHQAGKFDGIGFILNAPGETVFVGVDFDDCLDENQNVTGIASNGLQLLDSYAEMSPSGKGVKLICKGQLPPGKKADHKQGVEMYVSGRYFTITGHQWAESPSEITERSREVRAFHGMVFPRQGNEPAPSQYYEPSVERDILVAVEALEALGAPKADGYYDWLSVGMALHDVDDSLLDDWDRWSQTRCREQYQEGACRRKWASFHRGGGQSLGSLIYWAREDGWEGPNGFSRNGSGQLSDNEVFNRGGHDETPRIEFPGITSEELANTDYALEYLIDGLLVRGQPGGIFGSKKSLKTNLSIDLAMCLSIGGLFLGQFQVTRAVRMGIMSGESGAAVIQETARRIAHSYNWSLENFENVIWEFSLPRLGDFEHLLALDTFIKNHELDVVIIDPTYLCMPVGDSAGNLFVVGALLSGLTALGQKTGCTVILVHHTRKGVIDPFAPPELEDIAWSGFQEWVRQWFLIGRRQKYDPDQGGHHELWINVGGSAGHSGLWGVDIDEGSRQDPGGVRVLRVSEARQQAAEGDQEALDAEKILQQEATTKSDRAKILTAFKRFPDGETKSVIRDTAGITTKRFDPIFAELLSESVLESCQIRKDNKQTYGGYRLENVTQRHSDNSRIRLLPSGLTHTLG